MMAKEGLNYEELEPTIFKGWKLRTFWDWGKDRLVIWPKAGRRRVK